MVVRCRGHDLARAARHHRRAVRALREHQSLARRRPGQRHADLSCGRQRDRSVLRAVQRVAPFNQDTALNQYLYGGATGGISTRIPRLLQFVGTVSGDLGRYGITSPLADQGIAIALGAEYREEMERTIVNEVFQQNNGGENQRFTQSILEANAEVQAPLIEHRRFAELLQVNAGYRVSQYNRLDGKFDTWKVEGLWSPVADITLRASYNKSQAAPGVSTAQGAANIFWNQASMPIPVRRGSIRRTPTARDWRRRRRCSNAATPALPTISMAVPR
ncbi:TonB-dependent receptor [Sphingomonas sp. Ant20]|uniref:TonB-dependent receptor domain-containing protein n=1 Tax=Sphingomonas sp. Ant20 TaxID=104605 RepID=UPI0027410944|nr:TonB-dependent receptor [Sphingomonas sp. Ant20]